MSELISTRIAGALVGGALGDVMGDKRRASEASSLVLEADGGLEHHEVGALRLVGPFTACTQLVLFTSEALLLAGVELERSGTCLPPALVFEAYRRWLAMRGASAPRSRDERALGWLQSVELLAEDRSPDATSLEVIAQGRAGRLAARLNEADDAGALPRAVPGGFLVPGLAPGARAEEAYYLGCEIQAVTHGHDDAINAGGALAAIIGGLVAGTDLAVAVHEARELTTVPVSDALERALTLGREGTGEVERAELRPKVNPSALEALELALVFAQRATLGDAMAGVLALPGEVRLIGSICGSLIGARDGIEAIPASWLSSIEGVWLVEAMAHDCASWLSWLAAPDGEVELPDAWLERYA